MTKDKGRTRRSMNLPQKWWLWGGALLTVCVAMVLHGLWLIVDSLYWVRAAHHRVSPGADGAPERVLWQTEDDTTTWHSAPYPDVGNVRVVVGSRSVWFRRDEPGVLRAFNEDQPVSAFGLMLVGIGLPVAVGFTAAVLWRVR